MRDTSQTPYDIKRIPNCESLTLYRIPRSRFYQYRFWVIREKKYKRGSTRTENFKEASQIARQIWMEHYSVRESFIPREKSIAHHIAMLQTAQERKVERGQRSDRFAKTDKSRFKLIQEFFKNDPIDHIDGQRVQDFEDFLHEENPTISKATVRHYFVALRKVLKQAALSGVIKYLPQFPEIGAASGINVRTGFSRAEYKALRDEMAIWAKRSEQHAEVYDVIIFLANSLLRPSEIKLLKNEHIRIGKDKAGETLFIRPPNPKVKAYNYETFTMEGALKAYERMKARYPKPSDYIFFNDTPNRDYALRIVGDIFSKVLDDLKMRQTTAGKRTLYSLRHSAISWRLEDGEAQIFDIAKWARTSVAMIEKFYASAYQLDAVAPQLRARKRQISQKP
jgi:hypothetical protein